MVGVVTATVNRERAAPCFESWRVHAARSYPLVVVDNGSGETPYLGPVAAFRVGVERMFREEPSCDVIACFHDDLVILDHGWDRTIEECFTNYPDAGLVGFAGWAALGDDTLYHAPYDPEQLRAYDFHTNGAGVVSRASVEGEAVVCVAAFSQVGRRQFWSGFTEPEARTGQTRRKTFPRPWAVVDDLKIVDHFYFGALGCLARRGGWQVRYLPVRYRHLGGETTDRDAGYHAWAADEIEGGDRGFWESAHRIGYDTFRDVLPLRLAD
jgi:hypothetical protein